MTFRYCCLIATVVVLGGFNRLQAQVRLIGTTFEGRAIHAVAHQVDDDMFADPFADDPTPVVQQVAPESMVGAAVANCSRAACANANCADPACEGCAAETGCGMADFGSWFQCELGDAWTLSRALHGDCPPLITVGGWLAHGYHTQGNDLFNSRPNKYALHQAWIYAEKVAEACESPLGFRADILYGIDANDTQAFGNPPGSWDYRNGFDHGAFGWAIPQLYGEVALGDWRVKAGHFFTLIGYEVIPAPGNFFYSHAMTMYHSEPFTHTGVLASRHVNDRLEIHAGWTLGWDTGFDQLNNGSSWLGGLSYTIADDASFTYMSTAGNFGGRGDQAYSHSIVLDMTVTEQLNWVVQSDLLRVDSTGQDTIGINQYLFYTMSDCLALGARVEWWKGDVLIDYAPHGARLPSAGTLSYYAATFGANIRPTANFVVRPEVRIDWSPAADYDTTYFGIDSIFTF